MTTSLSATAADDPLALERWRHRVLLVFSETERDPALRQQRAVLAKSAADLAARDVRIIEIIGDLAPEGLDGRSLRAAFWSGDGFRAVLVGKDGGPKLRQDTPVGASQLMRVIDSMPMGHEEAARRGGS